MSGATDSGSVPHKVGVVPTQIVTRAVAVLTDRATDPYYLGHQLIAAQQSNVFVNPVSVLRPPRPRSAGSESSAVT